MFTREIFSYRRSGFYPLDKKSLAQACLYSAPSVFASFSTEGLITVPESLMKLCLQDDFLHNYFKEQLSDGLKPHRILVNTAARYLILAAVFEETVFRGFFQKTLLGHSQEKDELIRDKVTRVMCTAIPFAFFHMKAKYIGMLGANRLNAAILFTSLKGGLLYGGLVEITDNLWAATLTHFFHNLGVSGVNIYRLQREVSRVKL